MNSLLTSLVALLDESLEMQPKLYLPPHFSYAVKIYLDNPFKSDLYLCHTSER